MQHGECRHWTVAAQRLVEGRTLCFPALISLSVGAGPKGHFGALRCAFRDRLWIAIERFKVRVTFHKRPSRLKFAMNFLGDIRRDSCHALSKT